MSIRAEKDPRPPDKRETAMPAGGRHGGKESHHKNYPIHQDTEKQGTPDRFVNDGMAADD